MWKREKNNGWIINPNIFIDREGLQAQLENSLGRRQTVSEENQENKGSRKETIKSKEWRGIHGANET